jgi:phosphatidylglycerol:prolipoprotein diacylglycerol transferase
MFPEISDLIAYFFDVPVTWPIPTFGFFVALAFTLSYFTFLAEFKRKEAAGVIKSFKLEPSHAKNTKVIAYLDYGFLGFIVGFKVVGAYIHAEYFFLSPFKFIFSLQGSWLFALLCSAIFVFLFYWRQRREKADERFNAIVIVHPYQLMPKLVLWAAIWGFLGAKIFNYLENFQRYNRYSFVDFLNYSGLTFLGGLTFGGLSFLYIGYRRGMRLIDLADIGSPGMLVAYGVGRIGCHLSGDGDWGIKNTYAKPFELLPNWMWSFRFPHNVLNQGEYMAGCTGNHCFILPQGVFPTSYYESIIILACFLMVWFNRKRITTPGLMFCFYLIIIGFERFFIENLRLNFKYNLLGWELSQAQIISLIFLLLAALLGINLISRTRYGYRPAHKQ